MRRTVASVSAGAKATIWRVRANLAALQQLHKEGSRNIQHSRCVLGRQFGVDRNSADRVPLTNFGQDVHKQPQRRHRDADRVRRRA